VLSDEASPAMNSTRHRLTVLQAKFAAYLSWSQPFLHDLVTGVGRHVRNVVVCNRTEHLERFPTPNIVRLKTRFLMNPSFAVMAAAYLRREWKPDVIHAHFGWSGIRVLLLKQFLRIPLVTTFGGRDASVQMHLPHLDRMYEILLDASDQIICVSGDLKRQLVEQGVDPDRIAVIRRGADLSRFAFVDRSERPPSPVQILMVGRLVEKKGHRYAFEALSRIVEEGHLVRLTVVGEGESYRELHRLRDRMGLRKVVTFAGITDQPRVRRYMNEADIFLHCSVTGSDGDREGIPNVVVEASATGLPVVATRHGGIVELVSHERGGLLVEERDTPALIEALRRLITDRPRRLALGRTGSELMRQSFDLDRQIAEHVAIYERLAATLPQDSPRLRQRWVAPDFAQLAEQAIGFRPNAREFSLAELTESLVAVERPITQIANGKATLFERFYEYKRFVPPAIKFPLKVVFARALVRLKARKGLRYGQLMEYRRTLDHRVLDYFADGGDLDRVQSGWGLNDLEALVAEKPGAAAETDAREPVTR